MKAVLGYYDSSTGVTPIVNKLPHNLQEKWTSSAIRYMQEHHTVYPPFSHFAEFLRQQSRIRNNPSFLYETSFVRKDTNMSNYYHKNSVVVKKTNTHHEAQNTAPSTEDISMFQKCPIHNTDHLLNKCRAFRLKSIQERMKFLKEKKICFRCCASTTHIKKDCKEIVSCKECNSGSYPTALHVDTPSGTLRTAASSHSGEVIDITSKCTQICGRFPGKSCAKILLANVHLQESPEKRIHAYVMLDDQSNRTLASTQLFDSLGIEGQDVEYILTSGAGKERAAGRRAHCVVVESLDHSVRLQLPAVTECSHLPNNREEIPTPEVAQNYAHLLDIAQYIPPLDDGAQIMLLIGRDVIQAHHVLDQRIGPANAPYAQKLPLGWAIIGETCLGSSHLPEEFNVTKTNILESGRGTILEPCQSKLSVCEKLDVCDSSYEPDMDKLFERSDDDEKPGLYVNDKKFLEIVSSQFQRDKEGFWTSPLPFKPNRQKLQNNYDTAMKRAKSLDRSLEKNPLKKEQFLAFMEKMFQRGHAERAPPRAEGDECWFLPIFGVYHPRKKDQVRVVFDSAVKHNGVSLNDVLCSGPDLTNSLLGVLLRFRQEPVAIVADIEQMFYCFKVNEEHRNYLRFLWHEGNEFHEPLVEFRMCVHVFGNTASPAIATYGLRFAVNQSQLGADVSNFVCKDFYVDDGLKSLPTIEQAIDLLQRTQKALKNEGNLRLHKIASNREEVMQAFPPEDLSKDLKDLEFGNEILPVQRTLGVSWNLESDAFLFHIATEEQQFTRRGVLSTINSIFDPLGFLAPVIIDGKLLMRQLVGCTSDWDEPLPLKYSATWEYWVNSLKDLHGLSIPRTYLSMSWTSACNKSVHIFSDASEQAVAAVGYLVNLNQEGRSEIGFILGKSKVAPKHGHTIPRLELCGAVIAVEIAESIATHLELHIKDFTFYTDSKVVLGYIQNDTRRFYTYVANRVARIRASTLLQQWRYVCTSQNPADRQPGP
ncbi:uncharacterized protein LOC134244932 [Saccostrea cucullata]|uniref:uncharacterized protein LOC134244932 n=1 Tax=Saccostrea cuccullata TaxID=36930 RepID=UPI002ED69FC5